MDVSVKWDCAMLFTGTTPAGATTMMDTSPEHGGVYAGPAPMETLLIALAGCTGMDVVPILKKMRAPLEHLTIEVHADRAADHPRVLTAIHLRYVASGAGLTADQVRKAVALSQDRYCSVSTMLRKAAPVTYEVVVNDTRGDLSLPARAIAAA